MSRPAAPPGSPLYSASQLETWKTCPRKWAFRYIAKAIPPERKSTILGSAVHEALESYLTTGQMPAGADPKALKLAWEIVPVLPIVVQVEAFGIIDYGDFRIQGFADWLGVYPSPRPARGEDCKPMGRPDVVGDHKTTSDFRWIKEDLTNDLQARVYAYLFRARHLEWNYVKTKGKVEVRQVKTWVDPDDFSGPLVWAAETVRNEIEPRKRARLPVLEYPSPPSTSEGCSAFGGCPYSSNLCTYNPIFGDNKMSQPTFPPHMIDLQTGAVVCDFSGRPLHPETIKIQHVHNGQGWVIIAASTPGITELLKIDADRVAPAPAQPQTPQIPPVERQAPAPHYQAPAGYQQPYTVPQTWGQGTQAPQYQAPAMSLQGHCEAMRIVPAALGEDLPDGVWKSTADAAGVPWSQYGSNAQALAGAAGQLAAVMRPAQPSQGINPPEQRVAQSADAVQATQDQKQPPPWSPQTAPQAPAKSAPAKDKAKAKTAPAAQASSEHTGLTIILGGGVTNPPSTWLTFEEAVAAATDMLREKGIEDYSFVDFGKGAGELCKAMVQVLTMLKPSVLWVACPTGREWSVVAATVYGYAARL